MSKLNLDQKEMADFCRFIHEHKPQLITRWRAREASKKSSKKKK